MNPCTSLRDRQALVATDASNRELGVSPTKPSTARQIPLTRFTLTTEDVPRDYIGIHPVKDVEQGDSTYDYTIASHQSIALLLGRARNAADEETALSEASESQAIGSTPIRRITLPSSAKHVSRDHAVIFYSPFGSAWAVKILGQNGLIVNGKRKRAGVVLKLIPLESTLDFFGVKCLFVGSQGEDQQESSTMQLIAAIEDGHSPEKRAAPSSPRPSLGTVVANPAPQTSTPSKRKTIGNPLKRPLGAPPSPPTSSPARFDASSSPTKRGPLRVRTFISTSSPVAAQDEEDEDSSQTSDEESEVRGSPSLSRRGAGAIAKADDSGVAFEVDSADEASQVLRGGILAKSVSSHQESEVDESGEEEEDSCNGPSPAPVIKRSERRVKFVAQDSPRLLSKDKVIAAAAVTTTAALPYFQRIQAHLRSQVALLAETYDLQGLLAQAIVLHRTATISATEAVRSVLSSTPGLLRGEVGPDRAAPVGPQARSTLTGWSFEEIAQSELACGDELDREKVEVWQKKAWREKLEECLMEGECFGIISRAGKDASGNPLECWYYYDKDGDADLERAANLGSLAKPMRAALKTHKPIFWKKSAYGHSSEAQAGKGDQTAMASESQWGSSGSTLDSLLFSRGKSERETSPPPASASSVLQRISSSSWEETQYEERERTWDRQGDDDFVEMRAKKVRRRR